MEGSKLRTCAAQASRFGGSAKIQSRRQLPAQHTLTSQSQQLPRQSQQLPRHGVRASCTGSAKTSESFVRMAPGATSQNDAQTVDFPDPLNPCKVQSRDWLKT
eukprot:scaffold56308_cov18-Tisochrysis_lutea.AAC.1